MFLMVWEKSECHDEHRLRKHMVFGALERVTLLEEMIWRQNLWALWLR